MKTRTNRISDKQIQANVQREIEILKRQQAEILVRLKVIDSLIELIDRISGGRLVPKTPYTAGMAVDYKQGIESTASTPVRPVRGFTCAVRSVLQDLPKEFVTQDVFKTLQTKGIIIPNPDISNVLGQLRRRGVIKIIKRGGGPISHLYALQQAEKEGTKPDANRQGRG